MLPDMAMLSAQNAVAVVIRPAESRKPRVENTCLCFPLADGIFGDFMKIFEVFDDVSQEGMSVRRSDAVPGTREVVLMPLIGGLVLREAGNEHFVATGELVRFRMENSDRYEIVNPFGATINYLWMVLNNTGSPALAELPGALVKTTFSLSDRNCLIPLPDALPFPAFIGKYEGREEGRYHPAATECGLLIYVIEGAFEVHDRLLHPRDALLIQEAGGIGFEALSHDAILLIMEL